MYFYVFFVFIKKKQPQAVSHRPVAHPQLDLTWDLSSVILRIILGFTVKISISSLNNAVFLEAFVLQLLFVHKIGLVIPSQLLLYIAFRCGTERESSSGIA